MKKVWSIATVVSACVFAFNGSVCGQETAVATPAVEDSALPSGKEILAKHIQVVGGAERLKALKSTHIQGKFQMPAIDMNAPLKITIAQPMMSLFEVEIPGMGIVLKGTNGETAWEISDITGPRILEGQEREQFLREADMLADLHPEKYFKAIECRGQEEVDGKPCYVVDFTSKDEEMPVETRYYDAESYLMVKNNRVAATNMGDIPIESKIGDYRDINGMKIPHRTEINMMEQQQLITFESVQFDQPIEDNKFDLPDEIKELMNAADDAPPAESAAE